MLERYTSNATVAKIRAIHGYMLTAQNFKDLLTRQSVAEVADYLKKTKRYHDALVSVDINSVHRGYLEELLHRTNFLLYERICRFGQLDKTDFYKFEILANEIEQILSCIMHINSGEDESFIESLPAYLISKSDFDMITLAKSKNMQDILLCLEKTDYYRILCDISPDSKGNINYFECEKRLRTYYYKKLLADTERSFDKKTAQELTGLITNEIDLINIINAYRMKKYFDADIKTVLSSSLPFYGRLGERKMIRILSSPTPQALLSAFLKTSYGRQLAGIDEDFIEDSVNRVRFKLKKRALAVTRNAPTALYAFLGVCDMEVENITNIIEGIRYSADMDEINKILIY